MKKLGPLALVALVFGLSLGGAIGCASLPVNNLLDSANAAQIAAAATYQTAVTNEQAAEATCRAALTAKALPLPVTPAAVAPACASVNVPLPYDPVKLTQASIAINSLYDGIRTANTIKTQLGAGASLPQTALTDLAALFTNVVADVTAAGVTLPPSVTAIAGQLGGTP